MRRTSSREFLSPTLPLESNDRPPVPPPLHENDHVIMESTSTTPTQPPTITTTTTSSFPLPIHTNTTTTALETVSTLEDAAAADHEEMEQQRKRLQEFHTHMDTVRVAEEAQEEELLRLAMELSISDSTISERNRLNLNELSESSSRCSYTRTTGRPTTTATTTIITTSTLPNPTNTMTTPHCSSHAERMTSTLPHHHYHHHHSPPTTTTAPTIGLSSDTITQQQTSLQQRRSILRQPSATTSSRSLDDFPYSSGIHHHNDPNHTTTTTTTKDLPHHRNDNFHRQMVPRSVSARSDSHHHRISTTTGITSSSGDQYYGIPSEDQLLLGNNNNNNDDNSDFDFDDIEDDDDDDDISFEDLDPDDTPELKRVQQQQPSPQPPPTEQSPSHSEVTSHVSHSLNDGNRTDQPTQRRKATIPLNEADLSATSLRFQQFSSSMSDGLVLDGGGRSSTMGSSISSSNEPAPPAPPRRYGQRRIRPGLVVSVHQPAPKVKPPGRPRTVASRQSPAIDEDVLRKIQAFSTTGSGGSSSRSNNNSNNNNNNNNESTRSNNQPTYGNAPASKPGAVAIIGAAPTKAPEVRSAIVSHVLSGGSSSSMMANNNNNQSEARFLSSSSQSIQSSERQPYDRGRSQSHEDTDARTAAANTTTPGRSTAWNNSTSVAQSTSASNDTIQSDWPSLNEQRSAARTSGRNKPVTGENDLTEQELRDLERALRESATTDQPATAVTGRKLSNDDYDLSGASLYLSQEELLTIQEALNETVPLEIPAHLEYADEAKPTGRDFASSSSNLPPEMEDEAIARALREADEEEERRSFELAIQMQQEEAKQYKSEVAGHARLQQHGNVQSMTRQEYEAQKYEQQYKAAITSSAQFDHDDDNEGHVADGFRMNSSAQQKWSRRDQTSVSGPNQEVRTKHDRILHNEANAHRLGILSTDGSTTASVGNKAYNSFVQSMKSTSKGVATKGTGRAGSDTDATKGGAMDPVVRQHISRAINNEIIEKCNGVVKEGKEAVVYHADKGAESGGFDVAVKVFKKITEFRNRGYYVEGDPRFGKTNYRNLSSKEQLEIWTEKEFRNLTRASRAGVPVPIPLFYKDNILFMRFLGDDGWPAPQLRELELNHGSRRWSTLFSQIMDAVKLYVLIYLLNSFTLSTGKNLDAHVSSFPLLNSNRLFQGGHLVHGDLSEYNILVAPSYFVVGPSSTVVKNNGEDLQIVLIDFGQAVDTRHPEATLLLERDLDRILTFFTMQGIDVPTLDEAMVLIMG